MSTEETFEVVGKVLEIKPNDKCIVEINVNGITKKIIGSISGKIRKFRIKITKGDTVKILMTKYDLNQGRIIFREKEIKHSILT